MTNVSGGGSGFKNDECLGWRAHFCRFVSNVSGGGDICRCKATQQKSTGAETSACFEVYKLYRFIEKSCSGSNTMCFDRF